MRRPFLVTLVVTVTMLIVFSIVGYYVFPNIGGSNSLREPMEIYFDMLRKRGALEKTLEEMLEEILHEVLEKMLRKENMPADLLNMLEEEGLSEEREALGQKLDEMLGKMQKEMLKHLLEKSDESERDQVIADMLNYTLEHGTALQETLKTMLRDIQEDMVEKGNLTEDILDMLEALEKEDMTERKGMIEKRLGKMLKKKEKIEKEVAEGLKKALSEDVLGSIVGDNDMDGALLDYQSNCLRRLESLGGVNVVSYHGPYYLDHNTVINAEVMASIHYNNGETGRITFSLVKEGKIWKLAVDPYESFKRSDAEWEKRLS